MVFPPKLVIFSTNKLGAYLLRHRLKISKSEIVKLNKGVGDYLVRGGGDLTQIERYHTSHPVENGVYAGIKFMGVEVEGTER